MNVLAWTLVTLAAVFCVAVVGLGLVIVAAGFEINKQEKVQFSSRNWLRVVGFGVAWQVVCLAYSAVLVVGGVFRGSDWVRYTASHEVAEGVSRILCSLFFGEVILEGMEHIPTDSIKGRSEPAIVAPNHSSMVDVMLCARLPADLTWVAKKSVFFVPGVGQMLWAAQSIALTRGKKSSALQMLEGCRQALDDKWSVLIYPQGTRDRQKWRPWKYGAFKLAIEKQVPVVPVSIVLPDDTWTNPNCTLIIRAHPPVAPPKPPASVEEMMMERRDMSDDLRDRMDAAIKEMSDECSKRCLSAFPADHSFHKTD